MIQLTPYKVRQLAAEDLGVAPPEPAVDVETERTGEADDASAFDIDPLEEDDPMLEITEDLLTTWGGVILVGPPGTSKSYFAARLARTIAGDISRVHFVQFHPSYQYEDFVIGYVPKEDGDGFELKKKHLLLICEDAAKPENENKRFVIVIDELSRGEPGRIFGEALTYVEKSKRDFPFHLASGLEVTIPGNVVFIATMNPLDRGVDEVDAAFERRFAKIPMDPDEARLQSFLLDAGMPEWRRIRLIDFFRTVANKAKQNPYAALGHTFFIGVSTETDLRRIWTHQLRFLFDKAFRLDRDGLADIERAWEKVLAPRRESGPDEPEPDSEGDAQDSDGEGLAAEPPTEPERPAQTASTAET